MAKRFSKDLQTTKRKWLTELRESDASLGGWNPDATASDRPMGDFAEIFNLRKMKPGELETRSGYKRWLHEAAIPPLTAVFDNPPGTPLWKAEYRMDTVFVDVTFYIDLLPDSDPTDAHSWHVFAYILHPELSDYPSPDPNLFQIKDIGVCGLDPKVCAYQFGTFLIVSIIAPDLVVSELDSQVYAMWADDPQLTLWNNVRPMGKQVTPTPNGITFADGVTDTVTGKLFAFIPKDSSSNDLVYAQDPATGEALTTALDIKASYWLSGSPHISKDVQPLWTKNKTDATPSPPVSAQSIAHVKSRGWWYRPVLKRKFKDARGQNHIISEAPGADFYAEERIYVPVTLDLKDGSGNITPTDQVGVFYGSGFGNFWDAIPLTHETVGDKQGNNIAVGWYPSDADGGILSQKLRDAIGNPGPGDPMKWAAMWLRYFANTDTAATAGNPNLHYGMQGIGLPPYKMDVGSYRVNGSPNAKFTWAAFHDPSGAPLDPTIDTTLYAIDFYRTAYSYPDEKDNATKDPLWGTPYNYGFAGTLHAADATFLDNIPDTGLLFDQTPLQAQGFLEGQFAGEVMRPYQDHLVLGNLRQKERALNPWPGIQSFAFDVAAGGYVGATDFAYAPDGRTVVDFYYAYQDRDGNLSDAVRIDGANLQLYQTAPHLNVAFLFPRGYSDRITSAVLYRSVYEGGQRNFYRESATPLATGVCISTNAAVANPLFGVSPAGVVVTTTDPVKWPVGRQAVTNGIAQFHTTVTSIDPGYIMWSKKNNPWEWPEENILNVHDQNPITGMDEVIGPLYVWSDRGVSMTRTDSSGNEFGYLEPVHTSSTGVGCISRFAIVKVDQVVFHIGAGGLFYTGGSGVVPFPADIQTEVTRRLRELFPESPSLHGVRERVSLSWNANRKELMLSFPSTVEVGGVLPARTFVVKFMEDIHKGGHTYAYEFELAHEPREIETTPTGRIIYLPHADGSLFSAYYLPNGVLPDKTIVQPKLVVQDNDRAELWWPGQWAFQYQHAMGTPNVSKRFFQFNFLAEVLCRIFLKCGVQREDNQFDRINGTIDPVTPIREARTRNAGALSEYRLGISGSVLETSGTPPAIRISGEPNPDTTENWFKIESFDIFFGYLHQHKG